MNEGELRAGVFGFDIEKMLRGSVVSAMTEWHKALAVSGTDVPFDEDEMESALADGSAALKTGASPKDAIEVSLLAYYAFLARKHPALAPSLEPVVAELRERHLHLLQAIAGGS
jgi:hypothetical protein